MAQIISYGDSSFKILKTDDGETTRTNIIPLDKKGKIDEIVRIIGGFRDESSIKHAEQLIKTAEDFKIL